MPLSEHFTALLVVKY